MCICHERTYRNIKLMPGVDTLGRIPVNYSKPATRPRRHVEHVYTEIGPPELPPRCYRDDYMVKEETPADEHGGSVNASPEYAVWENQCLFITGGNEVNTSSFQVKYAWNHSWPLINSFRPRQHGHHFADGIFQIHFLVWNLLWFDKFVTDLCSQVSN